MGPEEYRSRDGVALADLVRSGEVTPIELLESAFAAAESLAWMNAVVTRLDDRALEAIRAGLPPGALSGVPFALKDLWTRMAGVVTSNGSRLFADDVAPADSEIVGRLRRGGLVVFAKTNTPELGLSPTTEPALFGPTRNPWDPGRIPGGSSGGAAAAVAGGILPVAHATDGGGSIRIPAACCGVFGLKPSRGLVPVGPERGEGWNGMSTQNVVSRSVRDTAAALDLIAGSMPGDPYAAPTHPPSFLAALASDPPPLRVGVCTHAPEHEPVDAVCRRAAEATGRRLEALGHRVVEVSWPFPTELLAAARSSIVGPHVAAAVDARAQVLGRPIGPDELEPFTTAIVEAGRRTSALRYVTGVQAMHEVGRAVGRQFEAMDVLVTPTLAAPPLELGLSYAEGPRRFLEQLRLMTAFTAVANVTGQPAMSLPLDQAADGLPIGTQVVGRFGDDATLLRLARQLETAHPWFDRVPPLVTGRGSA